MRWTRYEDCRLWDRWFAWFPVWIEGRDSHAVPLRTYVWLEMVERRWWFPTYTSNIQAHWEYRFPNVEQSPIVDDGNRP